MKQSLIWCVGMLLLLLFALLFIPSDAGYTNALRVKCDELLYRTAFVGTRCYFAVDKEVKLSEASAQCSSIVPGATVSTDVTSLILNGMMVEKSKYHRNTDSDEFKSRAKFSICVIDNGYTCEVGEQSSIAPGKCVAGTGVPKTFGEAESYCKLLDMELPTIDNEWENLIIRGAIVKDFAWIRDVYLGPPKRQYVRKNYFSRYSTCQRVDVLFSGPETPIYTCGNPKQIGVLDKTGLWGTREERFRYGVVCVKNAVNEFTVRNPCIPHHALDEETGLCEWTGPKDACLQTIDDLGRTWWGTMPNFPKETARMLDMHSTPFFDRVMKVIVRRGCMYTGFGGDPAFENKVLGKNDLGYGVHRVPCYYTGDLPRPGDGLSVARCFCDPTEATLNDHEPAPPPKKKCIEHHTFNEATQSCEWKHDPKFCGELITSDGRRQMVEIPSGAIQGFRGDGRLVGHSKLLRNFNSVISDWPTNRKYDVDHWSNDTKKAEDFHVKITEVIVRQHCWFTMNNWAAWNSKYTLDTSGYGRHQVHSYYNGKYGNIHDGTHRVICECLR